MAFLYRSVLQAVIILSLYRYPVLQVLLTLILNVTYTAMIIHLKVYRDRSEQMMEQLNEVVTIVTIYFLLCYTGQFVLDLKTRD